jgi:hypothetical protein
VSNEELYKSIIQRLENFTRGFEMVGNNLAGTLQKIEVSARQLAENTSHLPELRKENKKTIRDMERLDILIGEVMTRLNTISQERMI